MDGPVFDLGGLSVKVGQSVLHPVLVVPVGAILPGVGPPGLLSVLGPRDGRRGTGHQVLQLEGLDQVGVPDQGLVRDGNLLVEFLNDRIDLDDAVLEGLIVPVDGGVFLHGMLELAPDFCGGGRSLPVPQVVEILQGFHSLVFLHRRNGITGRVVLGDLEGAGPSKDDNVQERVRPEPVGPVDARGGDLAGGKQTGNGFVLDPRIVLVGGVGVIESRVEDLPKVVGGDASHVVVHGGQRWDGFLGDVDAGKDGGSFGNSRQSLRQQIGGKVIQVQIDLFIVIIVVVVVLREEKIKQEELFRCKGKCIALIKWTEIK
jgi:hypothetical protein